MVYNGKREYVTRLQVIVQTEMPFVTPECMQDMSRVIEAAEALTDRYAKTAKYLGFAIDAT